MVHWSHSKCQPMREDPFQGDPCSCLGHLEVEDPCLGDGVQREEDPWAFPFHYGDACYQGDPYLAHCLEAFQGKDQIQDPESNYFHSPPEGDWNWEACQKFQIPFYVAGVA